MKKIIGWIAGAVALVAIIAGAAVMYDKFGSDFAPEGGGLVSLAPFGGFEESTTPPPEEIEPPSTSETEPLVPETETKPEEQGTEAAETETQPPETEARPEETESEPPETESQPPETETAPPETETESPETTPAPPAETEPAPSKPTLNYYDFTVLDANGTPVKLSDYTGKPIVLNFWASWCGYCLQEMPDFEAMYKKYGDRVNFLMVNVGDNSLEASKKYAADNGYTFPVFFDYTEEAMYTYGATSIPKTFFFDANGNPLYYAPGMIDGVTLENTILDVLSR